MALSREPNLIWSNHQKMVSLTKTKSSDGGGGGGGVVVVIIVLCFSFVYV